MLPSQNEVSLNVPYQIEERKYDLHLVVVVVEAPSCTRDTEMNG